MEVSSSTLSTNDPKLQERKSEEQASSRAKEEQAKEAQLAAARAEEAAKITGVGQSLNITV